MVTEDEKEREALIKKRVAAGFRELRKVLGWTQQQMAAELGVSVTAIARYEMGLRRPDREVFRRVSAIAKSHMADFSNVALRDAYLEVAVGYFVDMPLLVPVRGAHEAYLCGLVLEAIRLPMFGELVPKLETLLAPVEQYLAANPDKATTKEFHVQTSHEVVGPALDMLPATEREVLVRRYMKGEPIEEICRSMSLTDVQVRTILANGRKQFVKALQKTRADESPK